MNARRKSSREPIWSLSASFLLTTTIGGFGLDTISNFAPIRLLSRPPPPPIFVFLVYFLPAFFFLFGVSFPVSSESEALIWEGSGNLLIHETDCLLLPLNIPPSLGTHINQPSPNFYPLSLIYFGDSNLRSGEGFSVAGLSFKFTLQITALPSLSIPNILLYGNGS